MSLFLIRVRVGVHSKGLARIIEVMEKTDWIVNHSGESDGIYLETLKYGENSYECARIARMEVENYGLRTAYVTSFKE